MTYTRSRDPSFPASISELDRDLYGSPKHQKCVIFCITARVGSTALLSAFSKCVGTEQILEIFNDRRKHDCLAALMENTPTLHEYFSRYQDACMGTCTETVFKTNFWDFNSIFKNNPIDHHFDTVRYVYLERESALSQSYSLWKAQQLKTWHWDGEKKVLDKSSNGSLDLSIESISKIIAGARKIESEKTKWKTYFDDNNIVFKKVMFEEIVEDISAVLSEIYEDVYDKPLLEAESYRSDLKRLESTKDDKNIEILNDAYSTM